jgi:hypothetical protein
MGGMSHKYHPSKQDKQVGQSGKAANDTNKAGSEKPTQKNEAQRTPSSRHDRDSQIGGGNQTQARRGSKMPGNVAGNGAKMRGTRSP